MGIWNYFENVKSIAIAGVHGLNIESSEYKLGEYICIFENNEELDNLYKPHMKNFNKHFPVYSHYIVAFAEDERYGVFAPLKFASEDDATRSITLAQLSLAIYCKAPVIVWPILGFAPAFGTFARVISTPPYPGTYWEIEDENYNQRETSKPYLLKYLENASSVHVTDLFKKVALEYYQHSNRRWILSAYRYLAGINQTYVKDALLDFSISLEALLNFDAESIGYKLRLYSALILGKSFSERQTISNDIKKFYTLRSLLMHGKLDQVKQRDIDLIYRVGSYIAGLLIRTCGKNIDNEVLPELEYQSLLGLPQYLRSQYTIIITEDEIYEWFLSKCDNESIMSHKFFIDNIYDREGDMGDLVMEIEKGDGTKEQIDCSDYLHEHEYLKNIYRYKRILTKDGNGKFQYIINSEI